MSMEGMRDDLLRDVERAIGRREDDVASLTALLGDATPC